MAGIPKRVRYDPSALLGSPSVVNIGVGGRSIGKTYSMKRYGIQQYLKHKWTWIYLRRYESELRGSKSGDGASFFADITMQNEFPGYEFRVNGNNMELRLAADGDESKWQVFGYFMALSKFQNYKGVTHPDAHMVFFDEFIKENNRTPYLPDEVDKLYNIWETLDRQDSRVKIFMMANAVDIVNPYFLAWDVRLPPKGQVRTYKHGKASYTIQYIDDAEFTKFALETDIGKFTRGTSYESYARGNNFRNNDDYFIDQKPPEAGFEFALTMAGIRYGIWIDYRTGAWYVNHKVAGGRIDEYTLILDDMRPNMYMIERSEPMVKSLKRAIMFGYCYYSDIMTRETFTDNMRLLGMR